MKTRRYGMIDEVSTLLNNHFFEKDMPLFIVPPLAIEQYQF